MNALNSIGGAADPAQASAGADGANFDEVFKEGLANTSAVMLQLIGGDVIQSVLKDESAVD